MSVLLLSRPKASPRQRVISRIEDILGRDKIRWLVLPDIHDGLICEESSRYKRPVTYSATPQGRLTRLGDGYLVAMNPASTHTITTPDSDTLSFGNGVTDQPVVWMYFGTITDTGVGRTLMLKFDTNQGEFLWNVAASDVLTQRIYTTDAILCSRTSDAVIPMGSPHLYTATYDGRGGATAGNGMALAVDGATIASTAANNASYVAASNKTASVISGGDGATGMLLIAQIDPSVALQRALITEALNPYYGLKL